MKNVFKIIKATFLGGILFLAPLVVLLIIFEFFSKYHFGRFLILIGKFLYSFFYLGSLIRPPFPLFVILQKLFQPKNYKRAPLKSRNEIRRFKT